MRLVSLAAFAVGAAIATSGSAEDLKFANFMPATHPYVASTFQPFADEVKEKTGGKVNVVLYNGGELGASPVEQYSRAVDGVAELAISLPGYTAANFPLTLVTELPGLITEKDGTKEIWDHIDLFQPEFRRVHLVSLWSSAENVIFTRDKAVHSPADIKGLKIRVPSRNSGLIVAAWGATPVSMPVSEIYNAMQTGVIDGALIDGTATNAFRLGEVSKYITKGMKTSNSPFFIVMNRDAYNGLSKDEQAAIDAAGKDASFNGQASQLKVAEAGFTQFAAQPGKEIIQLTPEEAKAFDDLSAGIAPAVEKELGPKATAIVDALKTE